MMNDVCSKIDCKNTCCPWLEPDDGRCAQWKLTHLPSSGMKKQLRRNGVYQTNDLNCRKSCAVLSESVPALMMLIEGRATGRRTQPWREFAWGKFQTEADLRKRVKWRTKNTKKPSSSLFCTLYTHWYGAPAYLYIDISSQGQTCRNV